MNSWGKGDWTDWKTGSQKEWLVTNGLGGYASSTIINLNTRQYHGLFIAALHPPVERWLLVSQLDERLEMDGQSFGLTSCQTESGWRQEGFRYLQRVENRPVPAFVYQIQEFWLQKSIFMVSGQNTTVLHYQIQNGSCPARLSLKPLLNCRDFHTTQNHEQIAVSSRFLANGLKLQSGDLTWQILASEGRVIRQEDYFWGTFYEQEQQRGEGSREDHFMPARFELELKPYESKEYTLLLTAEQNPLLQINGKELLQAEIRRQEALLAQAPAVLKEQEWTKELVLAADAFVVQRASTGCQSLIAGYPWFNDWGRDAMIALPGLTLATGRYTVAREILQTYAQNCREGLLPNVFVSRSAEPALYNTVDASLWFFWAVERYWNYTQDLDFIQKEIYPVLEEIIQSYRQGTRFGIKMDTDGLIQTENPQLTWMDAQVGDWVVTPRSGKAVEISALWYNALVVMRTLSSQPEQKIFYQNLAQLTRNSFEDKFWYEKGGYYLDLLDGSLTLRPNQVIALSLPYSPASSDRAKKALAQVERELLTAYGLRTLAPQAPQYQGQYRGDRWQRDGAYHQGTVWSWLIGPFISAYRRAYGHTEWDRQQAERFLAPFREHLREAGIGFISEIFDGDEPHWPGGAIAQAWSVGEVLRVLREEI
ncbi:MAG: amylo-alpha-1,6-glucosidase [Clostridia bacterium]|nr:amylo-alpha-1,6-glucosidase [Clostridia bacterium]